MSSAREYLRRSDVLCYLHTCPQRAGFRDKTIWSIRKSDVGDDFVTIEHEPGLSRAEIIVWWQAELLRLCDEAERAGKRWLLRFEDDVLVNRHIMHNVCSWPALLESSFGMGTLFLWDELAKDSNCLGRSPSGLLYRRKHECPGSQCQLISTKILRRIVPQFDALRAHYWPNARGFAMDGCPSAAIWRRGLLVYIHEPSLVTCHDEGSASAQGNTPKSALVASSFDPYWIR
jgi:hypothetical protein